MKNIEYSTRTANNFKHTGLHANHYRFLDVGLHTGIFICRA